MGSNASEARGKELKFAVVPEGRLFASCESCGFSEQIA
jgi:hypothetical protein